MTLRQAAGQVLVVGLEGTQLSTLETAWLRLLRPGGVILFRRNIEDAAQTHCLLHTTQQAVESPMLRCIDVWQQTVEMGHYRPRQRTLPPAHFRFAPKADVRSQ